MDENKIKYGLKNVYYAKATFDEDGFPEYDTPVHIPGAVNLALDAEGEMEPWYADNMVYTVLNGNAGYSGDLEIAIIPESFATDILHEEVDANGLMLEQTGVEIEHFALLFQFEGDLNAIRHVFYNCTCSRPAIESATTEDTKEPQTDTLQLTAMPLASGYVKGKTCSKTPEGIYNGFFDTVLLPGGEEKTYTVYFYDGSTLLQSVHDVPFGGSAAYTGSTPTKEGYTFTGWDPLPENITKDTYCYAQFEIQTFMVRFYNGNTLLQTVTDVPYGGSAVYTGETPVSPDNPELRFLGWDPEPTNIKKDTDCYAQFEVQTYTVYFYNGDTLLQTVTGVVYGGSAAYTGSTPVSSENPDATFIGWDPEPVNITSDTYCYAQFEIYVAFAVYSSDDSGLIFYVDTSSPSEGNEYRERTVSRVFNNLSKEAQSYLDAPFYDVREKVKFVSFDVSFETARLKSTNYWFYEFENCENIDLKNINTNSVTSMSHMFGNCSGLTELDLGPLNTSAVTTMSHMFSSCSGLTELDLSTFDVSAVTEMDYMFNQCTALTTLNLNWINGNALKSIKRLFYGCSSLTSVDLAPFNVANDTSYLFMNCNNLTTVDLTGLDTSAVEDMEYMFYGCSSLKVLDLTTLDTGSVKVMSFMFNSCSELATVYSDDSKFSTENVSISSSMFSGCNNIVGGAGTTFSSNKTDAAMAHVDTVENPGYFTAK